MNQLNYLAPEILKYKNIYINKIKLEKINIFSFGLIIIRLILNLK